MAPRPSITSDIEQLRPLLSVVGELDLDDEGWADLRHTASAVITGLVADGRLPKYLTIVPGDPPARVAWALASAWQHATMPWPQRHNRY